MFASSVALLVLLACLLAHDHRSPDRRQRRRRATSCRRRHHLHRALPRCRAALRRRRGVLSDRRPEAHRADDGRSGRRGPTSFANTRDTSRDSRSSRPAGGAAPVKTRKNRWAIDTGGAARVTVRYRVYGREMSVRTNWVESRFALLQGAATYLTLVGGLHRPHRVTRGAAAGMGARDVRPARDGRGANTFEAADYDTLVDSPIVAGDLEVYEFTRERQAALSGERQRERRRGTAREPSATSSGSSPNTRSCGEACRTTSTCSST